MINISKWIQAQSITEDKLNAVSLLDLLNECSVNLVLNNECLCSQKDTETLKLICKFQLISYLVWYLFCKFLFLFIIVLQRVEP